MKRFSSLEERSIGKIFGNAMFVIPSFQRPYEWNTETCEKMFEDICDQCDDADKSSSSSPSEETYFLGSLVTYEVAKKGRDEDTLGPEQINRERRKLEGDFGGCDLGLLKVVDGQQRLTSLLILLIALRDFELSSGGKSNDENLQTQLDEVITGCRNRKNTEKNHEFVRIRSNVAEDEKFWNDLQNLFDDSGKGSVDFDGHSKIYENYLCFVNLIRTKWGDSTAKGKSAEKNLKKRRAFARFLMNNVRLLQIVCKDRNDAFKLFEVINSRGQELSEASVMKPRILVACGENKKERMAVLQAWNEMSQEKEKGFLENLFLYLRAIQLAELGGKQDDNKIPLDRHEGFKAEKIMTSFRTLCKMYAIRRFNEDPKFVVLTSMLDMLPQKLYRPALYKFMLDLFNAKGLFRENLDEKKKFLYEIEFANLDLEKFMEPAYEFCERIIRFYLAHMLTNSSARDNLRPTFKKLVVTVAAGKALEEGVLSTDNVEDLAKVVEDLNVADCYDTMSSSLSNVLVCLTTYLKFKDDAEKIASYSALFLTRTGKRTRPQREHIHPQNWQKCDGWTQDEHDRKTNSLGNLIPLENVINQPVGNECLEKKINGKGLKRNAKRQCVNGKCLTYQDSVSPSAMELCKKFDQGVFKKGQWLPKNVDDATAEKISLLKRFLGLK